MMSFKKMAAMGLLSVSTVLAAGAVALHAVPSTVAYATDVEGSEEEATPTPAVGNEGEATPTPTPAGETKLKETATYDTSCLILEPDVLAGNYIYVAYYSDLEGKKLKSTFVYTKQETMFVLPLGDLKLTKGASFRVYDEITGIDEVELIVVDAQSPKVKVKVSDITEDKLLEALEITVDGTKVTAENIKDYANLTLNIVGVDRLIAEVETADDGTVTVKGVNESLLAEIKLVAKANGKTGYVSYQKGNGAVSQAKFKVSAAPKAPKVTVDYVNGAYVVPKNASYIVTAVDDDGVIAIPAADAKWEAVTAKTTLTVDEILETLATGEGESKVVPTAAAIIVQTPAGNKKMASMPVVYKVEALTALTVAEAADKKSASVKSGEKEVATLAFTTTGVTVTAKVDIAYFDTTKSKWVTLKSGKSTKELPLANDGKAELKIKVLGTKASKTVAGQFGSAEAVIVNNCPAEATPTPTETPEATPTEAPEATPTPTVAP